MTDPYPSADAHEAAALGWVLHTLDRDDEVAFLVHLDGCPHCLAAVAELSTTTAAVGRAVPQEEPPARLREAIMSAVADEPEPPRRPVSPPVGDDAGSTVVPLRPRWSRARRLAVAAAAAAAVVLVAVVGGLVAANRSLTEQRDAQAARAAEVTTVLRDAGRPGAVHATLADPGGAMVGMVVEAGSGPEVLTTGLAANRPDTTYVLWALAGSAPHAVGTFDVSGSTPSVRSVGSSGEVGGSAGFAVSLEPGRTAPASPTTVVASGQVGR